MPNFHRSGQPGSPGALERALDGLLAGDLLLDDAAAGLQPVAGLLAALAAVPGSDELAGHAQALAEFRRVAAPVRATRSALLADVPRAAGTARAGHHGRPARGRRRVLPLRTVRLAAAGGALAATLGGLATAAYAGVLPAAAQQFAHNLIGAPAPGASHQPGSQVTPSGMPPTRRATRGLCAAYAQAQAHGTAAQQAAAFRKLAVAAGGAGEVADFCAAPKPGGSPADMPSQHPSGKPSALPTPGASGKPSAQPTPAPHPTGKPSAQPTPTAHPSGKPSARPSAKPSLALSDAPAAAAYQTPSAAPSGTLSPTPGD